MKQNCKIFFVKIKNKEYNINPIAKDCLEKPIDNIIKKNKNETTILRAV